MNEPIFIARQDTLEQEILPAHWLAQYKLFGEESYTFQDKEIWKKLCMSRAAANDRDMHAEALEEMQTTFSAEHTGKWMLLVYGTDAAALEGLATMAAIAANGTAMGAIVDNALLMHAIANSETAMQRIANSQTAMQRVANNRGAMDAIGRSRIARDAVQASPYYNSYIKENDMAIAKLVVGFANLESARYSGCAGMAADSTAMTAVAASSTAMTAVAASGVALKAIAQAYKNTANMLQFLKAVNASDTLVKRIYSTLTGATGLFGATQLGSQDGVADANSWATTSAAPNAFLACACGYYNSGGASVDVTYNGTVIAQNKTGTRQPGSVTSTNVNAITMAPSTFTENGDGWLAVQKFTAK